MFDVAVIGYGPTGATLAGLLGLAGLRVAVIERDVRIPDLPRAVHFDDEVMRVFQTLGIAGEVAGISRINAGMRFVDRAGRLILDWPRPQEVGPQGWYPSYRFHQPDLEAILRRRVAGPGNVRILTGRTALDLDIRSDGVRIAHGSGSGGGRRTLAAAFVVGCDGARSFVRGHIGGDTEDLGFHERWLVVDVKLARDRPDLGDFTVQHCHPAQAATYVRGPGLRRRWEIHIGDRPDHEVIAPGALRDRLSRWLAPGEAEIERAAIYTFHSVIARRWRRGRLLIAGDAAHQTPPFMGQGMCAGIRDAANLAWKLAAVRQGADLALLDTYQSERHPHVRAYIDGAIGLGRLINASDSETALRTAFAQPDGSYRMQSPAPRLGPGLWRAGPLSARPTAQPALAAGGLADDLAGYGAALHVLAPLDAKARRLAAARRIAVITPIEAPGIRENLAAHGLCAVLVRPDRHVLGSARTPGQIADLIACWPELPAAPA